ncbi:MAG: hypothetical protein ACP5G2_04400 [Candidatus Bipolaricaulaceae bacterium]
MAGTLALLFDRGGAGVVPRARTAAGRTLARRLSAITELNRVVIATRCPVDWEDVGGVEVVPDPAGPWAFGGRLAQLSSEFGAQQVAYFSAGSAFLMQEEELARLFSAAPCAPPYAILNNFYSVDFGLICPAPSTLFRGLERDNPLGLRLWEAGYTCYELPRTSGTQLDIDTPGELQLLALRPGLPEELRRALDGVPRQRAQSLVETLSRPEGALLLAGRVGGHVMRLLEEEAACPVRFISEGRGMEATGRAARGEVRSLLTALVDPPSRLVETLSKLAHGVVWDTRVLLAARGLWPLPDDRFACDLLQTDAVQTPFLRELAEACARAPIPFLLGGHALVSGGMYLAVELARPGIQLMPRRWRPLRLAK